MLFLIVASVFCGAQLLFMISACLLYSKTLWNCYSSFLLNHLQGFLFIKDRIAYARTYKPNTQESSLETGMPGLIKANCLHITTLQPKKLANIEGFHRFSLLGEESLGKIWLYSLMSPYSFLQTWSTQKQTVAGCFLRNLYLSSSHKLHVRSS